MFCFTKHYARNFAPRIAQFKNRNQIVFTIFRLIWDQMDVRLFPNRSGNGKYNLISVGCYKILKRFLRRTTGREAIDSLYPGGAIRGLLKPHFPSWHSLVDDGTVIDWFEGGPQSAPVRRMTKIQVCSLRAYESERFIYFEKYRKTIRGNFSRNI